MITVGIMAILAIATSVEIPMNFLGINSVRSVALAVCQRYGLVYLRLPRGRFSIIHICLLANYLCKFLHDLMKENIA